MILTIVCLLHCCTQVRLPHQITPKDQQVIDAARYSCCVTYPKSQCLIKLTSKEEGVYSATCGKENN